MWLQRVGANGGQGVRHTGLQSGARRWTERRASARRGGVLISALAFMVVVSLLLAGIGALTVSHYARARAESDYAAVLNLAEAGVNYEFRKISQNPAQADQASAPYTGTLAGGQFTVYCIDRNTGGIWTAPNNLYVIATGTIHGVTRTLKVAGKGYATPADYALYGVESGIINGTATTIDGDVGTNGYFTFNGHPTINGNVTFNGPLAHWQSPPNGNYSVSYNADPVNWPTVDSLANTAFPPFGLSWLATHNDNGLSNPPISNNKILLNGNGALTFKGKPGGANYYLTSLTCNGNSKISFDNTQGPINLWFGPSGTASTFVFNGGTAALKMTQDPTKPVRIYVATTNDVIFNGNSELDAGIYNYNGPSSGRVIFNGTPDVYGAVIANKFTLNGNPHIHYVAGYFQPSTTGYYGFDNYWAEINPIN